MKQIGNNLIEAITLNRGKVIISFPFIALEVDGKIFDVAEKTEEGKEYLLNVKEKYNI
jgi:hypothetical protein